MGKVSHSLNPARAAGPAVCLGPEPEQSKCPGQPLYDLLPRESCYNYKAKFPINAIARGKLQDICAIFPCQPCAAEMVRKDITAQVA